MLLVNALNKHSDENLDDSENAGGDKKLEDNDDTAQKGKKSRPIIMICST